MKAIRPFLTAAAVLLGSGCVAIPMGKETFTTDIPDAAVEAGTACVAEAMPRADFVQPVNSPWKASIGLSGDIKMETPVEQHHKTIVLDKRKRLAVGLLPWMAPYQFRPQDSLSPMEYPYLGGGEYGWGGTKIMSEDENAGDPAALQFLGVLTLGLVGNTCALVTEAFAPFEKETHVLGRLVKTENERDASGRVTFTRRYSERDIELLLAFSPGQREEIGAWTFHEAKEHPHYIPNNGQFIAPHWFGYYKYCTYVIHDPVPSEKIVKLPPKVEVLHRDAEGPYSVELAIPDFGFSQQQAVPAGKTMTAFDLSGLGKLADGRMEAEGLVRFSAAKDGNPRDGALDAALLEAAKGRVFRVSVTLPPASMK